MRCWSSRGGCVIYFQPGKKAAPERMRISTELSTARSRPTISGPVACQEVRMKWAGLYFLGFALLIGGILAALWKLGILQNIETAWIVIGVVILLGVGIMVSIANSGTKQNIKIDQE